MCQHFPKLYYTGEIQHGLQPLSNNRLCPPFFNPCTCWPDPGFKINLVARGEGRTLSATPKTWPPAQPSGVLKTSAHCLRSRMPNMGKKANPKKIKVVFSYSIEEAAQVLELTPQTIRSWERDGLRIMKSNRPHLISGLDLKNYLVDRQQSRKQPLLDKQLFCLSCKEPTEPYGLMADYIAQTNNSGRLEGLCSMCDSAAQRFVRHAGLRKFQHIMDIQIRDASED